MELAGSAALVTGGAAGIGAAIAADFEAAGARVVVADLRNSQIVVDLSRPGDARRMVAEAIEHLGDLDVLVNNAGGYSSPSFPVNDDWRSAIELNLLSAMEAIEYALPSLAKRPGCVVNVSSSAAFGADPYSGVEYAVAKAGLIRLTSALGTIDAVRRSLETRTLEEIAPPPATLLDLEEVVAAVRELIEDDSVSGRVTVLTGGDGPRAPQAG